MEETERKSNEENIKNSFIETDKIKLSVIIIGSVLFLGYLKQYIFYRYFNLDISNYIEIQEVFTPFIYEMCYCIGYIFFYYILNDVLNGIVKSNKENLNKPNGIRFFQYVWNSNILIITTVVNGGIILYMHIIGQDTFQIYCIIISTVLYLVLAFVLNDGSKTIIEYKERNFVVVYILNVILLMFYFNTLRTNNLITYKRDTEFKETKYKILLNKNKEIITDSLNIYLGRTENNFFIYEPQNNKTIIYNTSDIIKEEIIKLK